MSRWKTTLGAALIMILCAGCRGSSDNPPSVDAAVNNNTPAGNTQAESTPAVIAPAESLLPTNAQGVVLVAKVNGEEITQPEFERVLARRQQDTTAADYAALAAAELDTLIEQTLIEQAAADMGIIVTAEDVEAEFQANRAQVTSDEAWNQWLAANLFTEEEFREMLNSAILTRAVRDSLSAQAEPRVTQVNARHILVNTQAEAEAALARLQAGEDFAALATELTNDVTTRQSGGDLGWFIREDLVFTPELAEVAFQLQPGQIAGPIPTQLGYHIIQTLEIGEREAEADEQATLVETQFNNWLQSLLETATIERYLN